MDQVASLKTQLPAGDRGRLAAYLDDVREIERRIHKSEKQMTAAKLDVPDTPTGAPENFEDHIKMLFDLQMLAFRADITRISTLMLAHELSNAVFPATNIRDGFHNLSHHSNVRANMDRFAELNAYHHSMLAYFLEKLKATPDGDGNLLDHSLVLFGSGMSDSNQHNHNPLPMLLAGGASGAVKGGRHIRLAEEHDAFQPAADDPAQGRSPGGKVRRQHGNHRTTLREVACSSQGWTPPTEADVREARAR